MKKRTIVTVILFVLLLLGGCAHKIEVCDTFSTEKLDEATATEIISALNQRSLENFDENNPLAYDDVFSDFSHLVLQNFKGEIREEVLPYFIDGKFQVPCYIVDEYLEKKFNVVADSSKIDGFDAGSNTYLMNKPAEFSARQTKIHTITPQSENLYVVEATVQLDEHRETQRFTILFDGDYQLLSLEIIDPTSTLSATEKEILSILKNFQFSEISHEFSFEEKVPLKEILSYFECDGILDSAGNVYESLKQYATGEFWEPYIIPAEIVENYLTARFNTAVDRMSIDCFDPKTNCYTITPLVTDSYYEIELEKVSNEGNVYTIDVIERSSMDANDFKKYRIVLHMDGENYKFLSFCSKTND